MRAVEDARAAYDAHRWGDAYRALSRLPSEALDLDDVDRLATAAYLTGRDGEGFEHWVRAHQRSLAAGEVHRAAHFGAKLAECLGFKGDLARCRGWIDRIARLLADTGIDCVEQGYLEHGLGMMRLFQAGDVAGAHAHFVKAGKVGVRFAHRDLLALARIGEGRMLIYLGEIAEGMARLDEAMVSIEARELSPLATGDAYCTIIDACAELFDVGRCRAWTESFTHWCDAQQELVLYRGHCLLHRAEMLALLGSWPEALAEARRARDRLAHPAMPPVLGAACALEGDLLRLAGELHDAEAAYERASEHGHDPQPGLALLRHAQGRLETADAMIRRALGESQHPTARARLLGPYVELLLAVGDTSAARSAAEELRGVASDVGSPLLRAHAARAVGSVLLAEQDANGALVELRRAFNGFNELGVRHDAACTRLLLADACERLGDHDTAGIESRAGRAVLDALAAGREPEERADVPHGLTQRELEVLRLLARGTSNRGIADELVVSEKTVASHVSHIFTKLDVTSRSAATAYAYDHHLV